MPKDGITTVARECNPYSSYGLPQQLFTAAPPPGYHPACQKPSLQTATGVPVSEFSGGATNSYLEKRGFTVVLLRVDSEVALQFTPGAVYDRKTEINGPFGGSRQSGISASATHPAIFIFTGDSGEQYGYADDWEDGAYGSGVPELPSGDSLGVHGAAVNDRLKQRIYAIEN